MNLENILNDKKAFIVAVIFGVSLWVTWATNPLFRTLVMLLFVLIVLIIVTFITKILDKK